MVQVWSLRLKFQALESDISLTAVGFPLQKLGHIPYFLVSPQLDHVLVGAFGTTLQYLQKLSTHFKIDVWEQLHMEGDQNTWLRLTHSVKTSPRQTCNVERSKWELQLNILLRTTQ